MQHSLKNHCDIFCTKINFIRSDSMRSRQKIQTVASSEAEAIILSSNGFHLSSITGPVWPATFGTWPSTRPV